MIKNKRIKVKFKKENIYNIKYKHKKQKRYSKQSLVNWMNCELNTCCHMS